jgi:hypothetical protein
MREVVARVRTKSIAQHRTAMMKSLPLPNGTRPAGSGALHEAIAAVSFKRASSAHSVLSSSAQFGGSDTAKEVIPGAPGGSCSSPACHGCGVGAARCSGLCSAGRVAAPKEGRRTKMRPRPKDSVAPCARAQPSARIARSVADAPWKLTVKRAGVPEPRAAGRDVMEATGGMPGTSSRACRRAVLEKQMLPLASQMKVSAVVVPPPLWLPPALPLLPAQPSPPT